MIASDKLAAIEAWLVTDEKEEVGGLSDQNVWDRHCLLAFGTDNRH